MHNKINFFNHHLNITQYYYKMTITQDIIKIDNHEIKVIYENNILWCKAINICTYLLYKITSSDMPIRKLISTINVKKEGDFLIKAIKNSRETKYINKQGITELLLKSQKPPEKLLKVANVFDIKLTTLEPIHKDSLNIKVLSKEQQTLGNIIQAFNGESFLLQHTVGKYKIDLYMPDYKLAIECDEYGHSDRNKEYEQTRENYIKNKLECVFIRFNPDAPDFNIFNVINKMYNHIKIHQIA